MYIEFPGMKENLPGENSRWLPLPKGYIAAFLLLAAGIGIIGYFYLKNQFAESRRSCENELSTIGNLKELQISEWYADHLSHSEYFFESVWLSNCLAKLESNPNDNE